MLTSPKNAHLNHKCSPQITHPDPHIKVLRGKGRKEVQSIPNHATQPRDTPTLNQFPHFNININQREIGNQGK